MPGEPDLVEMADGREPLLRQPAILGNLTPAAIEEAAFRRFLDRGAGRVDQEIGRASEDVENQVADAEGRLVQAEARHDEATARRDRRRRELTQQRALTLQSVEQLTGVLVLPHPNADDPGGKTPAAQQRDRNDRHASSHRLRKGPRPSGE